MVLDWGVHLIDQMLDFIKEPLIEVYAHLHSIIADEVDDVVMAEFRFESGLAYIVNVSMNCFITQPRWHACSIDGSLMVENWDADGRITKNTSEEGVEWAETIVYTAAGPTRSMAPRPQNTLENYKLPVVKKNCCYEYYSNIDAVVNNKAHLIVTPEQMTRVMKAIDAVFESDRLKRSVHLYHAAL
jgi:predicted dehydrogenase